VQREGTKKPTSLTVSQFQKLLAATGRNPCCCTLLLVAVSFGLRISELLGLQWQDVNWAEAHDLNPPWRGESISR